MLKATKLVNVKNYEESEILFVLQVNKFFCHSFLDEDKTLGSETKESFLFTEVSGAFVSGVSAFLLVLQAPLLIEQYEVCDVLVLVVGGIIGIMSLRKLNPL